MSLEHVLDIENGFSQTISPANAAILLKVQKASRYFLIRFFLVTVVLYSIAGAISYLWAPELAKPFFYGMALCTVTTFISFLITEWAFDQPNGIFYPVAFGSIAVRMFNLLLAITLGLAVLKFSPGALIGGMLVTYFSYLVIEIMYVHNKALLIGQ